MNLSEALSTFDDILPDIRKSCVENILSIQAQYQPYKQLTDDEEYTSKAIHQHANYLIVKEKTANYLRVVNRIDSRKRVHKGSISEADIAHAKDILLTELYEGQLFGKTRKYGLCPFHDEKGPSFYIFPNNRFKCFGCSVQGSPVDFVMLRDGKSFIEAVKVLMAL